MDHDHAQTVLNWTGNLASIGAIGLTLLGLLPAIGAVIAIVWYAIQIHESETLRSWRRHRRQRKIARLQAQLLILQATHERLTSKPD